MNLTLLLVARRRVFAAPARRVTALTGTHTRGAERGTLRCWQVSRGALAPATSQTHPAQTRGAAAATAPGGERSGAGPGAGLGRCSLRGRAGRRWEPEPEPELQPGLGRGGESWAQAVVSGADLSGAGAGAGGRETRCRLPSSRGIWAGSGCRPWDRLGYLPPWLNPGALYSLSRFERSLAGQD